MTNSSKMGRWNGWLTAIVVLIAIDSICTFPTADERSTDQCQEKDNTCCTPGCIKAASQLLDKMDSSLDPCDDFYKFACGSYIRETKIPDDKSIILPLQELNDRVIEQLQSALEQPIKPDELRPFALTKQFYNTCKNTTAIEAEGLKTAKSTLLELGGWPVVEGSEWKKNDFTWIKLLHNLRKVGLPYNHFMTLSVGIDMKNAARRIFTIDQETLGITRETLLEWFETTVVDAYYKYSVDLAVIFGADRDRALQEMKHVVEFETILAKLNTPDEKRRNLTAQYNSMTVAELQQKYPSIPWLNFLNGIIGLDDVKMSSDDIISVAEPKVIEQLARLLHITPKRILSNYVMCRTVKVLVTYLSQQLRDRQLQFMEVAYGISALAPRPLECMQMAVASMNLAASALYVREFFTPETKKNAQVLVSDLQNTYLHMLEELDWMDENTKKTAIDKAESMAWHVGYPEELLDDKEIEEYYSKIHSADSYLTFTMNILRFLTDLSLSELPKAVDKLDWKRYSSVAGIGAAYDSDDNGVQLPAGILQGVFFDLERPNYMNYGSLGFVIGHEISHGFDDMGSQFDKDGELSDWWEPETKAAFVAKAQCIIDQYSNYTAPEVGLHLNGINTQGENIADNGGIKDAYLAYNAWVERNGEEQRLPGLNYTPKQLFWISTANVWCTISRDQYLKDQILTDGHSPSYYRILGPFSNSDYFSADFNCPVGSGMNPKHKCHVW